MFFVLTFVFVQVKREALLNKKSRRLRRKEPKSWQCFAYMYIQCMQLDEHRRLTRFQHCNSCWCKALKFWWIQRQLINRYMLHSLAFVFPHFCECNFSDNTNFIKKITFPIIKRQKKRHNMFLYYAKGKNGTTIHLTHFERPTGFFFLFFFVIINRILLVHLNLLIIFFHSNIARDVFESHHAHIHSLC